MAPPRVDDLTKDLTIRYNHVWDLYFSKKRFIAFTMAEDLVTEPGLCADHEAGMHQLLACHPFNDDTVMHAQEVACMQTKLRFAKEHPELILEKKRKFDEDMAMWIFVISCPSTEFVKVDAQDARLEQAERDEQAERPAAPEHDKHPGDMFPLSSATAADDELLLPSQNTAPDTTSCTEESSQDQLQSTARVDAASPKDLHINTSDKEQL
ncbi:hypothetical protein CGLO_08422 [Colletotrichum gloeosporioides Cg-14]|uniref:Uncharacterized protein n=1 Tax=Colletotrichum gloeosporioides (strain Cg-14) TaxID=1237896 RepID=T0LUN7_COLGC|nr:hypothetical protein CGLO_08422 [Colletotrichum gloeosporioides Cg-14]